MNWLDQAVAELPGVECRIGLASFDTVTIGDSPAQLRDEIATQTAKMLATHPEMPEQWVKGVRGLLKQSGFKPTGRSKPASEYLAKDLAASGEFKFINNLVDINNLLSLQTFLPMSVLDTAKFAGTLHIRIGEKGEKYVFNPSGQELDLAHLLLVADRAEGHSRPLGTPIKDSQYAKLSPQTRSAVAIVYAPPAMIDAATMQRILDDWVRLTTAFAGATNPHTRQLLT